MPTIINKEEIYQRQINALEKEVIDLRRKAEIAESTRSIARKLICEFIELHGCDKMIEVIAAPERKDKIS